MPRRTMSATEFAMDRAEIMRTHCDMLRSNGELDRIEVDDVALRIASEVSRDSEREADAELLVAQLSVLAMCARQEGVNSKLRAMDGADDFYRHLIALTSRGQRDKDKYNDDAVALLALAVLAPLVMQLPLGRKLFDTGNVEQTYGLVMRVLSQQSTTEDAVAVEGAGASSVACWHCPQFVCKLLQNAQALATVEAIEERDHSAQTLCNQIMARSTVQLGAAQVGVLAVLTRYSSVLRASIAAACSPQLSVLAKTACSSESIDCDCGAHCSEFHGLPAVGGARVPTVVLDNEQDCLTCFRAPAAAAAMLLRDLLREAGARRIFLHDGAVELTLCYFASLPESAGRIAQLSAAQLLQLEQLVGMLVDILTAAQELSANDQEDQNATTALYAKMHNIACFGRGWETVQELWQTFSGDESLDVRSSGEAGEDATTASSTTLRAGMDTETTGVTTHAIMPRISLRPRLLRVVMAWCMVICDSRSHIELSGNSSLCCRILTVALRQSGCCEVTKWALKLLRHGELNVMSSELAQQLAVTAARGERNDRASAMERRELVNEATYATRLAEQRRAALEAERASADAVQAQHTAEIHALETRLQCQVEAARADRSSSEARVRQAMEETEQANTQVAQRALDLRDQHTEGAHLRQQLDVACANAADARWRVDTLETRVQQLKHKNEVANERLTTAEARVSHLEERAQQAEAALQEAREAGEEARKHAEEQKSQIEHLYGKLILLAEAHKAKSERSVRLATENSGLRERCKLAEAQLQDSRQEVDEVRCELATAAAKSTALQAQLAQKDRQVERQAGQLKAKKSELNKHAKLAKMLLASCGDENTPTSTPIGTPLRSRNANNAL